MFAVGNVLTTRKGYPAIVVSTTHKEVGFPILIAVNAKLYSLTPEGKLYLKIDSALDII